MTIHWDNPTVRDGWAHVADDPYRLRYFDDAAQAMDETNWDVLIGELGGEDSDDRCPVGLMRYGQQFEHETCADGTCEHAWNLRDGELWVRVDGGAWDAWERIARALSDYPLLDEDAYSEREFEAWADWWGGTGDAGGMGWSDFLSDVRDDIADELVRLGASEDIGWGGFEHAGKWYDYDVYDVVDELAFDPFGIVAGQNMAYWNGFTGEYDARGALAAIVELIGAAWRMFELMGMVGHEHDNLAHGIVRLPLEYVGGAS